MEPDNKYVRKMYKRKANGEEIYFYLLNVCNVMWISFFESIFLEHQIILVELAGGGVAARKGVWSCRQEIQLNSEWVVGVQLPINMSKSSTYEWKFNLIHFNFIPTPRRIKDDESPPCIQVISIRNSSNLLNWNYIWMN